MATRLALALLAVLVAATAAAAGALEDGNEAAERGAWSEAADHYAQAIEGDASSRAAALGLARAVVEARRVDLVDRAEAALHALREQTPDDLDLRLGLGRLFLHQAGAASDAHLAEALLGRAATHFSTVIEALPTSEEGAVGLARTRQAQGETANAIRALDEYLNRDPTTAAGALLAKTRILYEAARARHEEEGGGFPLSAEARRLYARAQGAGLSAATAAPATFDAWLHVAWTSQVLGDRETAMQGYERAYAIDPESPQPLQGIAVLLAGDDAAYQAALQRLKRRDPARRRVCLLEGYELVKQGKVDEAILYFESFLDEFGDDADALYQLGKLREGKGDARLAVELYERALAADGTHAHAVEELDRRLRASAMARAKKSPEEARALLADYRRILDLAPKNPYVRNNIAFALREGWKAHESTPGSRGLLLLSARLYEEASRIIGPWHADKERVLPWKRRYGYAQIVNDTAVIFHLFPPIRDLRRAERYYLRSLDYLNGGYLDAWTYLRKIYEEQARWDDLYDLALRCAKGLAKEDGTPYDAQRKAAKAVAQSLIDQGLVDAGR